MVLSVNIVAVIVVLLVSLSIALLCKRALGLDYKRRDDAYLFGYNNYGLAVSSNIGTLFSLTLYFAGMLLLGYREGAWVLIPIVATTLVIGLIFYFLADKHPHFMKEESFDGVISSFIGRKLGLFTQGIMVVVIAVYCFGVISAELCMLREYMTEAIFGNLLGPLIITLSFIGICYYYTKVGGFAGVLRTDTFQFLILMAWIVATLFVAEDMSMREIGAGVFNFEEQREIGKGLDYKIVFGIGMFFFYSTLLVIAMGLWTKVFGTLEHRGEMKRAVVITFPALAVLTVFPILMGSWYHGYQLNVEELQIPIMLVGNMMRESTYYSFLTSMAIVAVALTTVDSLLMHFLQNVEKLNHRMGGRLYAKYLDRRIVLPGLTLVCCLVSINLDFASSYVMLIMLFNMGIFATIIILAALLHNFMPWSGPGASSFLGGAIRFFRTQLLVWNGILSPIAILLLVFFIIWSYFVPNLREAHVQQIHYVPLVYIAGFLFLNRIFIMIGSFFRHTGN